MTRRRGPSRLGWVVLGIALVLVAAVTVVAWALGRASESEVGLDRAAPRHADLRQYCTFATATGAREGLIRAERLGRGDGVDGEDVVIAGFFDSVAASAPAAIHRDATRVHRAVVRAIDGDAPDERARDAAARVDAYTEAHCG